VKLLYAANLLFMCGGFLALWTRRENFLAGLAGCLGVLSGCICLLVPVAGIFFGSAGPVSSKMLPFSFDLLSAIFLLPVVMVAIPAALFSPCYLKGHDTNGKGGVYWFFFNMTLASMTLVTLTPNPLFFLVAWEMMGLMSFALVAFEYKSAETMRAARTYLYACHAGAAFLILLIVLLDGDPLTGIMGLTVFFLGLAGFGLKIGLFPLHVWLPEAHPAAPAPVSALMSGAMLNLGFYGLMRLVIQPSGPLEVYGWCFLTLGAIGALGGILFAAGQDNLKRLLAYSSIENMGVIALGLGLGFLGGADDDVIIASLGFSGAILHLFNHAVLKGGLFLCAGSVYKAADTLRMDRLGGLLKRMPWTGTLFTLFSLSISALPPFNGFLGEFLIYLAAFTGIVTATGPMFAASLFCILVLALTGGIAAGVFVKAVSAVFLGEPRSPEAADAKSEKPGMVIPIGIFAILCLAIALWSPAICQNASPLIRYFTDLPPEDINSQLITISGYLNKIGILSCAALVLFGLAALFRAFLSRGREERTEGTWDCGYAAPDARMEYTGSAFVQPTVDFFSFLLHSVKRVRKPEKLFPEEASLEVETPDGAGRFLWDPLFRLTGKISDKVRILQSGYLHLYILVMIVALILMLVWGFAFHPETSVPGTSEDNGYLEVQTAQAGGDRS